MGGLINFKTQHKDNKHMNEYFTDPSQRGGFDAMYYWDQFHPILAAIVILL